MIVDTHLHLLYPNRLSYLWTRGHPVLDRGFTLDTYLGEAIAAGVASMLHMEVDVAEDDIERETAFVTSLDRGVIGAISACRPEYENFAEQYERLAANPKVRGFRRILHTEPDELATTKLFRENVKRLSGRHSFDFCVLPRQMPTAIAIARSCPDVQFVLDHCGNPNIKGKALHPWRESVSAIAALPNVACKISGVVAYGDLTAWTVSDLRPYVEHCIAAFGWDRVVWGSDWPVCTQAASLTRWIEATHELLQGCSASEKERLFSKNAHRIYRLKEA